MVICCAALGCKNKQNSLNIEGNKLSFHRFPRDKDLCDAWLVASQRLDFAPTRYSYFCSEHFTEDQFNRTQKGCRLRPNAVPTVFPVIPKAKKKVPKPASTQKLSEVQPTVRIAKKKTFNVQPAVKLAPKKLFPVQPRVKILPKQTPTTTAPKPVVNGVSLPLNPIIPDLSSLADTVISSNLIEAAVSAYRQSTNTNMSKNEPTPVSIYVVHPQPNGTNIVTIPSVQNIAAAPTPNAGSQSAKSSKSKPLTSHERLENIQKIRKYEERIHKYRKDIKRLQQEHKRQQLKIENLKNIIKDLQRSDCVDDDESEEEDLSEDMSEDEIYGELLKHQTVDSENDDVSNDGNFVDEDISNDGQFEDGDYSNDGHFEEDESV